ncbi:MAG: DNA topoisomerase IB, partial [Anaerolineae bacterium]|nr:DNA topoisomerase IB [Anaerolineae bacterium]
MPKLRYISDDEPGYTRKKWGRGFTYQDENGETIQDEDLRAWIEAIVIPPAWTDVWISPWKNGHILATGRDDKGRKQYRYHPDWQQVRNLKKFNSLHT